MLNRRNSKWLALPLVALIAFACSSKEKPASDVPAQNATGMSDTENAAYQIYLARSNKLAEEYSRSWSELYPEMGSSLGYREYDKRISRVDEETDKRSIELNEKWRARLVADIAKEEEPEYKTDLRILLNEVELSIQARKDGDKIGSVPFAQVPQSVYWSLRETANEQSPKERKVTAVDRFKLYVNGYKEGEVNVAPRSEAERAWTEKKIKLYAQKKSTSGGKLFFPYRGAVEDYLKKTDKVVQGIEDTLKATGRTDWKEDFAKFKVQVETYNNWVRTAILPNARKDNRLPLNVYSRMLKNYGLSDKPEDVAKLARAEYQKNLKIYRALAAAIAKRDGLKDSSPKAVLLHLKQGMETDPEKMRERYLQANEFLSAEIKRRDLVALPATPLRIRVGNEAESAIQPAPFLTTPNFIGNQGERPEFVIPVAEKGKLSIDDFSFPAVAKGLTAHEGRPGHDLQFSTMLDRGVSLIRAVYAWNSVNSEGWGLYAEWLMEPSFTEDEKMGLMMARIMRNARMFLDPELQLGKITPEQAKKVITEEVGMSQAWADIELERYMFRAPGQATSYYYGYLKLRKIRDETEKRLGSNFKDRCFHDEILSNGLMPLDMLKERMRSFNCQPN